MTAYLNFGRTNVVAVRLENPPESSRWYPGGDLYRNTWLIKTGPVHFSWGGVSISTLEVTGDRATVKVA